MEFIDKMCATTVKVVLTMVFLGMASKAGVFKPIQNWWGKKKKEMEQET